MRRWHSIRFRLAAISGLAVGLAALVIGAVSYLRLADDLAHTDAEFARHEALEVAQVVAALTSHTEVVERVVAAEPRIFPEEGVEQLEVFTLDGHRVAALPTGAPLHAWPEGLTSARHGGLAIEPVESRPGHWGVRAAMLVTYAREPRWIVTSHVDCARSERSLHELARALMAGVPLAGLLVFGGTYALLALALQPLRELVRDAQAIADQGPGRRLAQPPPGSELAELARLLNLMLARTEETFARLKRFAADASHELRTPLARMRGEAEVALRAGDAAATQAALVSILDELDALRRMIDGLLELSRGETAVLRSGPPFDLGALVAELAAEAKMVGETRGLVVEVAPASGPLRVLGSRDLIGRAVWNVLENALKYVPAGGRVRVEPARRGEHVDVAVDDTGPGIPPELAEHLFQPFSRGDPSRTAAAGQEGHGLGLALARTVARRMGGDLVCERARPGARFVLTLPLAPADRG